MFEIVIGDIADDFKGADWHKASGCERSVLKTEIIRRPCRMDMLYSARDFLDDMVQIDFCRFAWKARRKQIEKLFKKIGYDEDLTILNGRRIYGVMYIDNGKK